MIRRRPVSCVVYLALLQLWAASAYGAGAHRGPASQSGLPAPISIYSHIPASTGSAANNQTTESLVVKHLAEVVRLKKAGVRFDYDLVDALWFLNSGFRMGPTAAWPNGPDPWIAKCRATRVLPGLRFGGNTLGSNQPATSLPPEWKASLSQNNRSLSLFEGGFLPGMIAAMQSWHDRGIRLFVFDSLDLTAATPAVAASLTADQIVERNSSALRDALAAFGTKNPDTVLLISTKTAGAHGELFNQSVDLNRLGGFEMVSAEDVKSSFVFLADPLRSMDIEADTRVRTVEQGGIPLAHVDSEGFAVDDAGDSGSHSLPVDWKAAFLLSMARGGWVNIVRGDLRSIQGEDARWMARVQKLFFDLQAQGGIHSFGGPPGIARDEQMKAYGFAAGTQHGSLFVVMNPSQDAVTLTLPLPEPSLLERISGRVQFRDAGFTPQLQGNAVTLGSGQLAVVGFGEYAAPAWDFGVQRGVMIPSEVQPLEADFESTAPGTIEARIDPPIEGVLRVVVLDRTWSGQTISNDEASAKNGEGAGSGIHLEVTQSGRPIPVRVAGDSPAIAGPSDSTSPWLVGEIDVNDLTPGMPVRVRVHSNFDVPSDLEGHAYAVVY